MATGAYRDWITVVQRAGGVVGTLPGTKRIAAKYPVSVWGPKANAHEWPLPDKMVSNPDATKQIEYAPGKFTPSLGYYLAPDVVQADAQTLMQPTAQETASATNKLLDQWGIPTMFRSLSAYAGSLILIAVVAGAAYYAVTRKR